MAEVMVNLTVVCTADDCKFVCQSHASQDRVDADLCARAHEVHCQKGSHKIGLVNMRDYIVAEFL